MTDQLAYAVPAALCRAIRWTIPSGALLLLAVPSIMAAQNVPPSARIGLLCGVRCEGGGYPAFWQTLRELGWVEGRNLVADVRGADGVPDRLPALVGELLDARPDILVAVAPQPARAAKNAASTTPIVFVAVADPIAAGLVTNLPRPGGNVTGLITTPDGFAGKILEVLKEALPTASRVSVLWSSKNMLHRTVIPRDLQPAADSLGACGSNPPGGEARGPADRATDEVRVVGQSADGEGAGHRGATVAAVASGSGGRVSCCSHVLRLARTTGAEGP